MPSLPSDCVLEFVNHVDSVRDLYALLTVSKDVFKMTAACLWYDPFRHVAGSFKSRQLLTETILALSPLTDQAIVDLRSEFNIKPVTSPTIDYLSLVRVMSLSNFYEHGLPVAAQLIDRHPIGPYYSIRDTLTWAIFAHQFENVVEMTIEGESIERFIVNAAPRLSNIRQIWIEFNHPKKIQEYYKNACLLVESIQAHHGQAQLRDCRSTALWNPLQVTQTRRPVKHEIEWALQLYRLLPPFNHLVDKSPQQDLVHPAGHLLDADIARLTELSLLKGQSLFLQALQKLLPDKSQQEILEQCRQLHTLNVDLSANDQHLFRWAEERRKRRRLGDSTVKLPSISRLHLNKAADCELQPVVEAIRAFCTSLTSLSVNFHGDTTADQNGLQPHLLDTFDSTPQFMNLIIASFPRLKYLRLVSIDPIEVDAYFLERCPALEKATLRLGALPHGESDATGDSAWPEVKLPLLTSLELAGRSTTLFHPGSFASTQKLDTLEIEWPPQPPTASPTLQQGEHHFLPVLHAQLAKRWVWTWPLFHLTNLKLGGLSVDYHFSFRILRFCPSLRSLSLSTKKLRRNRDLFSTMDVDEGGTGDGNGNNNAHDIDDQQQLNQSDEDQPVAVDDENEDDADDVENNNEQQVAVDEEDNEPDNFASNIFQLNVKTCLDDSVRDRFYNVQELELLGQWSLDEAEASYLLHTVLPGLSKLRLQKLYSLSAADWIGIVRRHPAMKRFRVDEVDPHASLHDVFGAISTGPHCRRGDRHPSTVKIYHPLTNKICDFAGHRYELRA